MKLAIMSAAKAVSRPQAKSSRRLRRAFLRPASSDRHDVVSPPQTSVGRGAAGSPGQMQLALSNWPRLMSQQVSPELQLRLACFPHFSLEVHERLMTIARLDRDKLASFRRRSLITLDGHSALLTSQQACESAIVAAQSTGLLPRPARTDCRSS